MENFPRKLAKDAMSDALKTQQKPEEIDAIFVGNMLAGMLGNQANLGPLFSEVLGVSVPAFRIEVACIRRTCTSYSNK